MKKKIAEHLRRWADKLSPIPAPKVTKRTAEPVVLSNTGLVSESEIEQEKEYQDALPPFIPFAGKKSSKDMVIDRHKEKITNDILSAIKQEEIIRFEVNEPKNGAFEITGQLTIILPKDHSLSKPIKLKK